MPDPPIPAAWDPPAPPPVPDAAEKAQAVVAAYVHDAKVSYSWYHSMTQLIGWDMANHGRVLTGGFISIKYGTDGLVESRNKAVREFLADGRGDWLWWVDTDMGFGADAVDRLFAAAHPTERPIVGGLCFSVRELRQDGMGGHHGGLVPTIYHWAEHRGQQGFAVLWDYPPDALVRCHGTGSAMVLIHRSALESIAEKFGPVWYDRTLNPSTGQMVSEDLSFCIRAGALDIPIHVHTGVPTSHHKEMWAGEHQYWRDRAVDPPPAQPEPEPAPEAREAAAQ